MNLESITSFLPQGIGHLVLSDILHSWAVLYLMISSIIVSVSLLTFHPFLKMVSKPPLRKYLGMVYNDIRVVPLKLSITITGIELLPSESPTIRSIFVGIFPSANVQRLKNAEDFPESKLTVGKLKIKVRMGSVAGTAKENEELASNEFSSTQIGVLKRSSKTKGSGDEVDEKITLMARILYYLPHPVIVIEMKDINIELDKVYLAPDPPPEFQNTTNGNGQEYLPSAIVSKSALCNSELPTFDQDYYLEILRNEEVAEADRVTFFIKRWINHVVTKMINKGEKSKGIMKSLSFDSFSLTKGKKGLKQSSSDPETKQSKHEEGVVEEQTEDEKMNSWIHAMAEVICHSLSIELINVTILISGAGSEFVESARKGSDPREANLACARLPRSQRSLTVVNADVISLSFSHDELCSALLCCVGLHVKVGNPLSGGRFETTGIRYAWRMVAHPFQVVIEVVGVIPFLIWAINYDHHWETRSLTLNLTISDHAITVTPDHLHTILLHLDDFTDPNSTFNEWASWLNASLRQTWGVTEEEKASYCLSYAILNGEKLSRRNGRGKTKQLTDLQLKEMEKKMTRYEIMGLRCAAMKNSWKIPKENREFAEFLRISRSTIVKDDPINSTPLESNSPFQRIHSLPLNALVTLIRQKSTLFAPCVGINIFMETSHIDFPYNRRDRDKEQSSPSRRSIPSSITATDVSFELKLRSPLFSVDCNSNEMDSPRPFLDLSLVVKQTEWGVAGTNAEQKDLPAFRDGSLVGMMYKHHETGLSERMLSFGLSATVEPTQNQDQHVLISFDASDVVLIANPLPLLSSIDTLIYLSDLPFRSPDMLKDVIVTQEYPTDPTEYSGVAPEETNESPLNMNAKLDFCVRNVSILFLIDRKRIRRGLLDLKIRETKAKIETGGLSGQLVVLTDPITIDAGQIRHHQPLIEEGVFCWAMMPSKHFVEIEGVRLSVTGREEVMGKKAPSETSSNAVSLGVDVNIGVESFTCNSSPSTVAALLGVLESLDPFWGGSSEERNALEEERVNCEKQKQMEEEQTNLQLQREALRRIFNAVDCDDSGTLQEEELGKVVSLLFDATAGTGGRSESHWNDTTDELTSVEVKREREYLISLIDPNRTNEVSFAEIDAFLYRVASKIDDSNLTPEVQATGVNYLENFFACDTFLSMPNLSKLVYFDDLREYSAMHEVFRITGFTDLVPGRTFPSPSLWRQGQGVELFWELYTTEIGCTRSSLDGHNISAVQRKLVRCVCNYEFAKFCWKTLVQPELQNNAGSLGPVVIDTRWLLDKDPMSRVTGGVLDKLLRRVYHPTRNTWEGCTNDSGWKIAEFNVTLIAVVDNAVLRFGSYHTFTNPLFELECSHICVSAKGLLSETWWFVPERETTNNETQTESEGSNEVHFQSTLSVKYLNTKHDYMENFVEPFTCFGSTNCRIFLVQDAILQFGESPETASFSINVNCPRFLNMNGSPSFFETTSILINILSQSDSLTYRKKVLERDINFVRNFWERVNSISSFVTREEGFAILKSASNVHWKDEIEGLNSDEIDGMIMAFVDLADKDGEGSFSFSDMQRALRAYATRCYFSGCSELQIRNNIGRDLKVSTDDDVDKLTTRQRFVSELDVEKLLNSFENITPNYSTAVRLEERRVQTDVQSRELLGRLSISTPGYKIVTVVAVSPYQSIMFLLKRRKGNSRRRRGGKHSRGASGFRPYLTIVPQKDSLDSISLDVRTCVLVQAKIPIKIRIVRLPKSLGYLRKRDAKSQIDLTKKNLVAALRRLVEGAAIVYENSGVVEGIGAPVPLDILMSSHYHALLIQDITENESNDWRDPVLLTKDFLFNPMRVGEVTRCHALSGVVVRKERLNVQVSNKRSSQPFSSDTKKSILRRTAWDTTIEVVPYFILSNSLPFPILVRTWQYSEEDEEDLWNDPALWMAKSEENDEENSSSDDNISTYTPSIRGRNSRGDQFHMSSESKQRDFYSFDYVGSGQTLRLNGISLWQPLFMQVSQSIEVSGITEVAEGHSSPQFMWSNPLLLSLEKLRTGMSRKGALSLPILILDMGDDCDALVDVSIEPEIRNPICTIYSPYWISNKTGIKMEYKTGSKRYLDSGSGGLPIMIHTSKYDVTSKAYANPSREIMIVPLECPHMSAALPWWDSNTNGNLVLKRTAIDGRNLSLVGWSDKIELDAAGTSGEVYCGQFILNVSIESLAGVFYRSNLITFTPRFVVKNMLHISISILPLSGHLNDVIRKASQLRRKLNAQDNSAKLDLAPGDSTFLYHFHGVSLGHGVEDPHRWVAFCVKAARYGGKFKPKWHIVPIDLVGSTYFGEHDGCYDTPCGILEAKVHTSVRDSITTSITHAPNPPFRIENRSSTHYIRFVQDDDEAIVFELPPMHSCGYTWDSPFGKKHLRAVVIHKSQSRAYQMEEAIQLERGEEEGEDESIEGENTNDYNSVDTAAVTTIGTDTISSQTTKETRMEPEQKDVHSIDAKLELNRTSSFRSKRRRLFTVNSRTYGMSKVGREKDLPCPDSQTLLENNSSHHMKMNSNLFVHLQILAGTKILSFNDSTWRSEQVELGLLRKGGDFKSAFCSVNIDGFGFYLMDEFPRELVGIIVRDIQIHKPMGSIDVTTRIRHFQVDAMLQNARYPIIIQPLPLGVDRRESSIQSVPTKTSSSQGMVHTNECFWRKHDEKPIPVFEVTCSYVPQNNMTWVPNIDVLISPMKIGVDVDYILRLAGIILNSVSKYQSDATDDVITATHVNDKLNFITPGQMSVRLSYIERLNISPVWFEIELNIKPDDPDQSAGDDVAGESTLTLNTIARSTNSAAAAGILHWIINVGANFAHVTPSFKYTGIIYKDSYCDIYDLLKEIFFSYIVQTIKQSYKVVFSMHLLGDPKQLVNQYKSGVTDLFVKTRDEVAAGGKDGIGKGVTSFFQNVVGGTFSAVGKASGGIASTLDSATTNDLTSDHLKPKSPTHGKSPEHAADGIVQGTEFLGKTVIHGIAGVVGNPYRGAKTGTISGFTKGVASGVSGLVVAPFVGALGFVAKTSDGIGATTKLLNLGVIEARCRPARSVPWGRPMVECGISYLKGIGIRVHTVRYQKVRKRLNSRARNDQNDDPESWQTSKEYKRMKAAEERRKNPPSKAVSIVHDKEKQHYLTPAVKPKLLVDHPGNFMLSHYAVTFEETIILRSSDFQLNDEIGIYFWNNLGIKKATTKASPLAVCKLSMGDIYSSIALFYRAQLAQNESSLSEDSATTSLELFRHYLQYNLPGDDKKSNTSVTIPAPQEFSLFRPCKDSSKPMTGDIIERIGNEIASIQKSEEDVLNMMGSDSSDADSDSSFLGEGIKVKEESLANVVKSNERLYGSISLSFFPIPW